MAHTETVPALRFIERDIVREDRGFLPYPNPLTHFPEDYPSVRCNYNEAALNLPRWLYEGTVRENLKKLDPLPVELCTDDEARLAFRQLSFFVSAYAWADCVGNIDAPHAKTIPANLAVPFTALAKRLGMKPILAYWMYAMYNFRVVNPAKPIRFDNLRLIQGFTIPPWDKDEAGFILPHVEIEAEAGSGLCAIPRAQIAVLENNPVAYCAYLRTMECSIREMAQTFRTIPSVCNPDYYFIHVRPWIFYFKDITYDGVGHFEQLKGETGAESTAVPSFDRALGIAHQENSLTQHLEQLKAYRPPDQAAWLEAIERGPSLKSYALAHRDMKEVRDAFNAVHDALIEFRTEHRDATVQYIKKKGRGEIATGGTHYEHFLGQLSEDTRQNMIT